MKSKSLFASKTFWLNLIGIAALIVPGLNIPPETLVYVLSGLNVANRVLTEGPVHVLQDAAQKP